jgi:hypothetical protein
MPLVVTAFAAMRAVWIGAVIVIVDVGLWQLGYHIIASHLFPPFVLSMLSRLRSRVALQNALEVLLHAW